MTVIGASRRKGRNQALCDRDEGKNYHAFWRKQAEQQIAADEDVEFWNGYMSVEPLS